MRALEAAAGGVLRHPTWLASLTDAAGACFDELVERKRGGRRTGRATDARSINLVRIDESDYSIALINLDRRLQHFCGRELSALHLRLRHLLAEGGIELHEESPFGTASVCRALRALKEAEKLSPAEALHLLSQLEQPLGEHLSRFYRDMEHTLADQAMAARLHFARPTATPELDWTDTPEARASLPFHPVDALRLAVLAQREAQPAAPSSRDPALAAALLERIEVWLSERQRLGDGAPVSLRASEFGPQLGPSHAAAVEVIETVCGRAESSTALPPPIRALFAGLRVPLLRLALRSEKLLSLERHPALRLLDRFADIGRTLSPGITPDVAVCRELASLVRSLARLPRPSHRDFEMALALLETLLATRQRNAIIRARGHIEAAVRIERREMALHQASRAVYLLVGQEPVSVARDFIERYWVHAMAKAVYLHGPDSPQWVARLLTASRLLSCAALPLDAEAARHLDAELSAVIRDLAEGLAWIALPEKQTATALDACREMQSRLAAGLPGPVPTLRRTTSPPTLGAPLGSPGLITLKHKQYVAGELPLPAEWAALAIGDCVAISLPNGTVMRGFVANLASEGQVVLIADGDSDTVLAITARAIAQQAGAPESRVFRGGESIVDEAASERLINP